MPPSMRELGSSPAVPVLQHGRRFRLQPPPLLQHPGLHQHRAPDVRPRPGGGHRRRPRLEVRRVHGASTASHPPPPAHVARPGSGPRPHSSHQRRHPHPRSPVPERGVPPRSAPTQGPPVPLRRPPTQRPRGGRGDRHRRHHHKRTGSVPPRHGPRPRSAARLAASPGAGRGPPASGAPPRQPDGKPPPGPPLHGRPRAPAPQPRAPANRERWHPRQRPSGSAPTRVRAGATTERALAARLSHAPAPISARPCPDGHLCPCWL